MVVFTASASFPRPLHLLFQPPVWSSESHTGWHCLGRGWEPTGALLLHKQPLFELTLLTGHRRNNSSLLYPKKGWRAVITASCLLCLFPLCFFFLCLFCVSTWQWKIVSLFKLGETVPAASVPHVEWMQCTSGLHHVRWTTSRHPQTHHLCHSPLRGPCAPSLVEAWALKLNSPISHPLKSDSCSTRKGLNTAIHLVSLSKGAVYLALADLGLHFKTILTCKRIQL